MVNLLSDSWKLPSSPVAVPLLPEPFMITDAPIISSPDSTSFILPLTMLAWAAMFAARSRMANTIVLMLFLSLSRVSVVP